MSKFQSWWGVPRNNLQVSLVTDSQASIEILQNFDTLVGIKDTLKPEMDVALELYHLRHSHTWIHWDVQKVESHIALEEAPNELFGECNAYVDTQATKAREEFSLEELKNRENYVLPIV